jgi:hypothetical protein
MDWMVSTPAARGFPVPASVSELDARRGRARRRHITPQAGRALEILGHAIEYLTDEYVHAGGSFHAHNAQLEAVQLLMSLNRQIYFECPEVPTWGERMRAGLTASAHGAKRSI